MPLPPEADFYHILQAASPVYLSVNHEKEVTRDQGQGQTFNNATAIDGNVRLNRAGNSRRIQSLSVRSTIAQTVVVVVGPGSFTDTRAQLTATVNTVENPANQNVPLAEVSVGAGLTVMLAAADATRQALRVGVKSSEANGVYIGDATVGAAIQGGYVEEGSADYVASEAAIYAYNPGAGAITVNLLKMNRV